MGHFSPRVLAAAMSRIVSRRVVWPPYSAPDDVALSAGAPVLGEAVLGEAVLGEAVLGEAVAVVAGVSSPWSAVIACSASRCALVASPDHLMIARGPSRWPAASWPGPHDAPPRWAACRRWQPWPRLRYD